MANITLAEVLKLPVPERLHIAEEIWDSIAAHPADVEVSDQIRSELDRRLANQGSDPSGDRPWSEVREQFRKKA